MSELIEIVDSLENKVSKLLHKMEFLKQENRLLKDELALVEQSKNSLEETIKVWEEKYDSLKLASSMLGSNEHKTETKHKINTLIREIDHCIAQLSE
ncbi:hypothetical protein MQE36_10555 [Zhouia spongiae]|uniref:Cell division protein ZapB n=1 Tax=Zhouia spongiae TaxID=2202721 RepID=A0ABY3YIQ1_9FLAO|nr:hypothetical protein [Zhouia spongiae]UNY97525.1 hypothetical protein MQE36_10555 [Zhouia spongiae]